MAGRSRWKMWVKVVGVSLLTVVLTNIGIIIFHFKLGTASHHSSGSDVGQSKQQSSVRSHGTTPGSHSSGQVRPVPLIVWWDPLPGQKDEDVMCGEQTCHVTVDRRRWQEQQVMVLSYYGSSLSLHDLPVPRRTGDLWALFHDESPKNLDFLYSHQSVMELFNYTSTFRSASHLPFPTQWLDDVSTLTSDQYVVATEKKSELRQTEKLAPVVYVQSDCSVPTDRDHLVSLLQQYVHIDSYGDCLHNKDLPNASSLSFAAKGDMSGMTAAGFYRVLSRYKFALAIENAVCDDYVTEKFWRPLMLGVVPIVFGAPNIKEFLPSAQSALVLEDFDSVQALAAAIHQYDTNHTAYLQLLAYKQAGITNPALLKKLAARSQTSHYRSTMIRDYHCMLCHRLHDATAHHDSEKPLPPSVADINHYGCPKPGKFNNRGQYVNVTGHWDEPWMYSQGAACVMRKLIEKGVRTNFTTFDAMVTETRQRFDDECSHYF